MTDLEEFFSLVDSPVGIAWLFICPHCEKKIVKPRSQMGHVIRLARHHVNNCPERIED